jgi:Ca-activated chloride channel homolog
MKIPMKLLSLALVLGLTATVSRAQESKPAELPSAPSSTLEKPKPQPPPPPQPQQQPAPVQAAPVQAPPQTAAAPIPKQEDPPQKDDENQPLTTIKASVDEVNLVFTVTDKHGKFVKDLKKEDFRVVDDNKPPKQIVNFSTETNLPLRVGLLIDASNSIRDRFRFEQEAAIEFLNQIVRPKSDRAFVIGFDTTAEITQDFTDSTEMLSKGVRMLRPGGGTALFDALYFACRDKLMKSSSNTGAVRKAVILISDGNDNQSRVTREEAIEMAQKAEVVIYTISTNISGVKERGDRVLERIADATGGRAFFPFKIQDVADAFSAIQDELRSQYALAYKPADFQKDGRFRSIDIVAENKKNLHVRARKGYFAPNQ